MTTVPFDFKTLHLDARNPADIQRAADLLRGGGTVAFPTETVYGVGANALSVEAVEKIFLAKQRPHWDPLIVHIAARTELTRIATDIPREVERLMDAFWPGPLTILLPRTSVVPDAVTASRSLVGVRIPSHPVALALLRAAQLPIAAPSANTFGHTSPTSAAHVFADLDGRIDAVLDGGSTAVGLESTVIEVKPREEVVIYRAGAVDEAMIASVVGKGYWVHLYEPQGDTTSAAPHSLPSPGVGIRHYAPRARVLLVEEDFARSSQPPEQSLVKAIDAVAGKRIGVLLPDGWNSSCANHIFHWGPWREPEILARRLYTGLRQLDDEGAEVIICPVPQTGGIAEAIRDRLRKAARS